MRELVSKGGSVILLDSVLADALDGIVAVSCVGKSPIKGFVNPLRIFTVARQFLQ